MRGSCPARGRLQPPEQLRPAGSELIKIQSLSKTYPGSSSPALDSVSLHIGRGMLFGLLGPNGAGKTTLLSVLVGLVRRDGGDVQVDGLDIDRDLAAIKRIFGFVPQDLAFYPMLTVAENLDFFAGVWGVAKARRRQRIDRAVETADLGRYLGKRAETLSGGLKRRLNLACGLLNQPRILCLDEPTVGIDPQSRHFILESIRRLAESGMTVIYTSHYMEEVQQLCDHVAIIDQGQILADGPMDELLNSGGGSTLRIAFGPEVDGEALAWVAARLGARSAGRRELVMDVSSPEEAVRKLAGHLGDGLPPIQALHYGHRDLEELFLGLTGKRLRD